MAGTKKPKKNAVVVEPNALGRPTKYRPEYCSLLIEHMSQGYSYETFAADIDVCKDTLYEWEKHHLDFSYAKKRAFLKAQKYWEKLALDNMINVSSKESGSVSLNTGLWIFNMKNRFKWTDRIEVKPPEEPDDSDFDGMSNDDLKRLV